MAKKPKAAGPLTEEEIKSSLKHSGYPLEIRLLQAFHEADFDPTIGHRFIPGEGAASAEIDLIARCRAELKEYVGFVGLQAVIEAKSLGARVAFVGLKWKAPTTHEMRVMRLRFSGVPSCLVLDTPDQGLSQLLLGGETPLAASLDPLNDAAVCPHWAYVRDSGKHDFVEASREPAARESFAKLARVTTWLECENASSLRSNPGNPPLLQIQARFPTIVLGTEQLYLYDATADKLERVDHLILQEQFEANGEIVGRYVDVVREAALPQLIARYRSVTSSLRDACDAHATELIEIARRQQDARPSAPHPPGSWREVAQRRSSGE
jgi:hypothetical protein